MSTQQWANIGYDPGALHALIERIPEYVPLHLIDHLWIFPARRIAVGESVVVVVAGFADDATRRRVATVHFTVARDRKGAAQVTAHFGEHAAAPLEAMPRVVQGVLRRLGEDIEASPREEHVGGNLRRWQELIVDLGGPAPQEQPASGAEHPESDEPAGSDSTPPPPPASPD